MPSDWLGDPDPQQVPPWWLDQLQSWGADDVAPFDIDFQASRPMSGLVDTDKTEGDDNG